ncbi:unnamed protein product [Clavelina lepadiformis]|uniref:Uncharacterized protein n=1 Tax=Clavelina lepadiformis TaxID=159417 RepID=A0ABP0F693_CLALP
MDGFSTILQNAYPETDGSNFDIGDMVTYSYQVGFILSGNPNTACTSDGWTEARRRLFLRGKSFLSLQRWGNNNWGQVPTCVVDKDCDFEDFRRPVCGFTTSGMNFNRTFLKTGAHGRGVGAARGYVAKASFERSQTNAQAILSSPSISRNTQICLRFYYRVSEFESGSDFYLSMTGSSQRLCSFNRLEPRNTWLGTDYSFPSSRNDLEVHFTAKSSRSSTTVELDDISFSENTPCRDECSIPDSCQNGGTCINRIDDYTCFCRHGYEGKDCSIRLDCLVPPAPTDGSVSTSSGNRVLLDGTITYSCDPGYFMKNQLSGTLKATCLRSGNWNRPTPVCEESRCIVPQTPAHGTLSRAAGEKVPADRSVSFTCDEGYTMIGQPTIYCRRSGTWSNEFPECVG